MSFLFLRHVLNMQGLFSYNRGGSRISVEYQNFCFEIFEIWPFLPFGHFCHLPKVFEGRFFCLLANLANLAMCRSIY